METRPVDEKFSVGLGDLLRPARRADLFGTRTAIPVEGLCFSATVLTDM